MKIHVLIVLLAALALSGCDKDHSRMDDKEIEDYLDSHNITTAVKDDSGVYYDIHEEGEGNHPYYYTTVLIEYKGYLTDGTVFDQTDEGEPLESRVDRFVEGFQIGLQKMKPGGSATIYIPSHLAYGEDGTLNVPEWSVIIFDVELIGFKE